jgi:hypothetical protein
MLPSFSWKGQEGSTTKIMCEKPLDSEPESPCHVVSS